MAKVKARLKKGLSFALIVSMVMSLLAMGGALTLVHPAPASAAGPNLLVNGSFETLGANSRPATWGYLQPTGPGQYGAVRDSDVHHDGAYSLKITADAGVRMSAYQTVAVVAGKTYKLSVWTKTNDATNAKSELEYVFRNAGNALIYTNSRAFYNEFASGQGGEWSLTEVILKAPDGPTSADKASKLTIANAYTGTAGNAGAAWFDDVIVQEWDPAWTAATGVALNKSEADMTVGDELQLTATVAPANASNPNTSWASSNPAVATVDSQGKVTAVGSGTATITVTTEDRGYTSSSCSIQTPAGCRLQPSGFVAQANISVEAVPEQPVVNLLVNGSFESLGANGRPATWGYLQPTGGQYGAARVSDVHHDGDYSLKLTADAGVKMSAYQSAAVVPGRTYKLSQWTRTNEATNANAGLEYAFRNASNAPIYTNGTAFYNVPAGGSNGEWHLTEVIVKATDGPTAADKAAIVVVANSYIGAAGNAGAAWFDGVVLQEWNAVTGVALDTDSVSLAVGGTLQMHATVSPANANNKKVTWSSSNEAVATVSALGKVSAVGNGLALITVRTDDGGYTQHSVVQVGAGTNIAVPDYTEETKIGVPVSGQVAATDTNNGALTYSLLLPAGHGNATVSSNGSWTYKPAGGFSGEDAFRVGVVDAAGHSAVSTVTIQVQSAAAALQAFAGIHARLILDQDQINALKTAIQPGGTHADLWSEFKQTVDSQVLEAVPAYHVNLNDKGADEMGWQGQASDKTVNFAFAYLMAGTVADKTKYKNAAIDYAIASAGYPFWGIGPTTDPASTNAGLAAGNQLFALAAVYDWLYDELSVEQKSTIRNALKAHGKEIYSKATGQPYNGQTAQVWWSTTPGHNYYHVLVTGLAAAALAIYDEEPEAVDWFKYSIDAFAAFDAWAPDDGASYEGLGYWELTMDVDIKFAKLARKIVGWDMLQSEFYENSSEYVAYSMLSADYWTFNSSFLNIADTSDYHLSGPDHLMRVMASEHKDGLAQSMAERIRSKKAYNGGSRWLGILYYDPTVTATPTSELPTMHHFDNLGLVISRSGWTGDESIVAFKSGPSMGHKDMEMKGYFGGGHQHPDANHFLIYANGEYLIRDDGYAHKRTSNHNTLLVDGVGQIGEGNDFFQSQPAKDAKANAYIRHAISNEKFDYMLGDAAKTYPASVGLTKFNRHLIYLKPDVLIVVDDIATSSQKDLELRFFPEQQAVNLISAGEYSISSTKSELRFKDLTPEAAELRADAVPYTNLVSSNDRVAFRVLGNDKTSLQNAVAFSWSKKNTVVPNVTLVRDGDKWTFETDGIAVELDLATGAVTEVEGSGTGADESDAGLASISVGGKAVTGFSADTLTYDVDYMSNKPTPVITYLPRSAAASVEVDYDGAIPGTAELHVTAGDGTERTYTVHIHPSRLLQIYGITTNGTSPPSLEPVNAYDEDPITYWSDSVKPEYIEYPQGYPYVQFDLNEVKTVNEAGILWYNGVGRHLLFDLAVSTDKVHWTNVYTGQSDSVTPGVETYTFDDVQARYIRLIGKGNNRNNVFGAFFSVREVYFYRPTAIEEAPDTVKVSLKDSAGLPLSGAAVSYYDGGWKDFGVTGASGSVSKSLPDKNYTFSISYEGTRSQKAQNTGDNANVVFQTKLVKVQLKDSAGSPLESSGQISYYADGWRTFGATSGGEARKELLPGNYSFNLSYEGAYQNKIHDVGSDPIVVFQTKSVKVRLEDSEGQPLDGGEASYYMNGWHTFGVLNGGEATKELLPVNYTFNVLYEGSNLSKQQDVGTDANVVFQTTDVAVRLEDGEGNPIAGGEASFYAGGWRTFGTTDAGGEARRKLLPGNYTFAMTFGGTIRSLTQDTAVSTAVVFEA
ncbi:Carbohydrate binding domain-containing protein [Cohnella sp. OV330]|uniref:Ig-like domain-containing protein n=1 Tax=Cohnella sp. OV330 TaxID=1855288 RepID=UPI0008E6F4A0|nr:Ig-like domain-containing protein [Cohnella sp. OV330]SFA76567.1 Carbohydrate binding domain-containing protein [Cohnella sp. OV330]